MDITNKDLDRRELTIIKDNVTGTLPEHFVDDYPLLVKLLEYYYEFVREELAPTTYLSDLTKNRDISQVDDSLLQYIEDELLLGQSYFQGFSDRRAASQYSSTLYRAKGSKYAIQQFFRTFYGLDPEIVYTKNNVFIVGDSKLGAESERYITDDKLYQTFALLIKVALPQNTWNDAYKLYVHPAGMYVGGEVQIETVVDNGALTPDATPSDIISLIITPLGDQNMGNKAYGSHTGIIWDDSAEYMRVNFNLNLSHYEAFGGTDSSSLLTIEDMDRQYRTIEQALEATSPTFDIDSAVGVPAISMDNIMETMDQNKYLWWDSDSSGYVSQITTGSNRSRL
jgi:hypothetical protein